MGAVVQRNSAILLFFVVMALMAAAQTTPSVPDLATILKKMDQAQAENHARLRAYTVKRDYEMFAQNSSTPGAQVIADVEFLPPTTKTYRIVATKGSSTGERVVRHILDNEAHMAKDHEDNSMGPANYDFQFSHVEKLDGHTCYVLDTFPKRKSKDLLEGKIWVDADTFLIRQIAGKPAKSPSWWVKDIQVKLSFDSVEGMWLQTASEGSADVRIFGPHTVRERALQYTTAATLAQKTPPPLQASKARPRRPAAAAVVGAGVLR